jgi:uncharacterized protein YciI
MFIIDLQYIVPLEELDEHMAGHVKFLQKYYKKGLFVASGRKVPRTGGIILTVAKDEAAVNKIMKEDPFTKHELAEYTLTHFLTSQYHPDLKDLLNNH